MVNRFHPSNCIKSNRFSFFVFGIIVLFLYAPYLIFGEKSFIGYPFDYLNSNVIWTKIIAENGMASLPNCSPVYPSIMNQPRVAYGTHISFIILLYKFFPVFWVLVINSFLQTAIGFFSMYLLLKTFIEKNTVNNQLLIFSISLIFSLLPFWPWGGIAISGFPLVFLILYNLNNTGKIKSLLILFLIFYILYSNLVVFNLFLFFVVFCYFLINNIYKKNRKLTVFITLFLLFCGSLLTEYRLAQSVLHPCFASNRSELYVNIKISVQRIYSLLQNSNQHAPPVSFPFLWMMAILFSIWLIINKQKNRIFWILLGTVIITNILSADVAALIIYKYLHLTFLQGFSLHRFNVGNQILWYLLLAALLHKLLNQNKTILRYTSLFILTIQFIIVLMNNTQYKNLRSIISPEKYKYNIRFSDYYMNNIYEALEHILPKNKKSVKLLHYGFDPAASTYHGYNTVDGFLAMYDKNYEDDFKLMIGGILAQNPAKYYTKPFHNYVVTENYSPAKNYYQSYSKVPMELKVDYKMMKKFGTTHILSTVQLTNNFLVNEGNVKDEFWGDIFVYSIR